MHLFQKLLLFNQILCCSKAFGLPWNLKFTGRTLLSGWVMRGAQISRIVFTMYQVPPWKGGSPAKAMSFRGKTSESPPGHLFLVENMDTTQEEQVLSVHLSFCRDGNPEVDIGYLCRSSAESVCFGTTND